MSQIYSLFPIAGLLLFLLPFKGKGKRGLFLGALLCLGALFFGWKLELFPVGILYGTLFLSLGLFQFPLKKEVHLAVAHSLPKQLYFQEELSKVEEECGVWKESKLKLEGEIEEMTRRFSFARHLVSAMEEETIFKELSVLFSRSEELEGFAFSTLREDQESKEWSPVFSDGSLPLEEWGKIIRTIPATLNRSKDRLLVPLSEHLADAQGKSWSKSSHLLVGEPIRWDKKAHGLLTFIVKEPLSREFLDQVSFSGQILGLGLHKISLYNMVLEHSRLDGLTQLYLRRVFLERLKEEISFSKRYGTSFSLLMMDLDHFKLVNDQYGHLAGDEVLKSVARTLKETLHPGVTICRYGGEEFAILIGLAPHQEVSSIAESLRNAIERTEVEVAPTLKVKITASIGICDYLPESPSLEEIISRADTALYKAKQQGRNCVRKWAS